jgi:hypothetical protein
MSAGSVPQADRRRRQTVLLTLELFLVLGEPFLLLIEKVLLVMKLLDLELCRRLLLALELFRRLLLALDLLAPPPVLSLFVAAELCLHLIERQRWRCPHPPIRGFFDRRVRRHPHQ